uniref:Uncharacterized protein n=1 Tax=Romanomermis culicivorax TaxID=13658 RepID=A0A915ITE1_ROMCU
MSGEGGSKSTTSSSKQTGDQSSQANVVGGATAAPKRREPLTIPAKGPSTQPSSLLNNALPQLSLVPSSNTAKLTAITGGNPMGVGTGSDTVVQPKQLSSASGNVQPPPLTGLKTRIGLISPANGPSTQPDSPPNNALPQLLSGFNTAPLAVGSRSRQQSSLPNSFVKSGVSGSGNLPKEPSPPLTVGVAIPNQPSVRPGSDRRPSSAGLGPIGVPTMIKPRDGRESIINGPLPHKPAQLNINGVQQASVPGLVMLGDQDRRLAEDIWRGNRKPNRYLIYITDWQRFKNRRSEYRD